jgi:ADP-ribosylglycohydrolase
MAPQSNPEEKREHYHKGLRAGDNTLNMLLVREVLKLGGGYTPKRYMEAVETFLTHPKAHNDLYYEVYLRRFFENKSKGASADQAAANQRDIWSIGSHGGLLQSIPMAVLYQDQPEAQAIARALEHMQCTHRSLNLMSSSIILVPLLRALLHGNDVEGAFRAAARQVHAPVMSGKGLIREYQRHKGPGRIPAEDMWRYHTQLQAEPVDFEGIVAKARSGEWSDADVVGQEGLFTSACYPEAGVPAVFYFALKTEFDFERALLDNANAGGDSAGRGALLGSLLGAAFGASGIPAHLIDGLTAKHELQAEIEAFVDAAMEKGTF